VEGTEIFWNKHLELTCTREELERRKREEMVEGERALSHTDPVLAFNQRAFLNGEFCSVGCGALITSYSFMKTVLVASRVQ
jgi:hypothetical protein